MTLSFHPLANLFPMFEPPEFEELVRDVRANGLRELIMLIDEGAGSQILDGRNRYRALLEAGLIGEDDADGLYFRKFVRGIDGDPLSYVLSKNLARRHLNESQRAMVASRLGKLAQGRPGISGKPAILPVLPQPRRAQETGYRIATVDTVLWRACANGVINSRTGEIAQASS